MPAIRPLTKLDAGNHVSACGRFEFYRKPRTGKWYVYDQGSRCAIRSTLSAGIHAAECLLTREARERKADIANKQTKLAASLNAEQPGDVAFKRRFQKATVRARLERQLERALAARDAVAVRPDGESYANLDRSIMAKKHFAVEWRTKVLAVQGELTVTTRMARVGLGRFITKRTYKVFAYGGRERFAVCASAGSHYHYRFIDLQEHNACSFNQFVQRNTNFRFDQ